MTNEDEIRNLVEECMVGIKKDIVALIRRNDTLELRVSDAVDELIAEPLLEMLLEKEVKA